MQNLSKGIRDPHDCLMASKCSLCSGLDTQIRSFTACTHPTLIHLRQIYRPAIDILIQQTHLASYPHTPTMDPTTLPLYSTSSLE
jgi:hypothetical protein